MLLTNDQLAEKVRERVMRKEEIKKHEKALADLDLAINTEVAIRGEERIEVAEFVVSQTPVTRETLDRHLLLQAGCTPAQIQAGLKQTSYTQLRTEVRKGL